MKKYMVVAFVAAFTFGLAPIYPEPHIWGKLRWVAGGANGMKLMDWLDLILHGTPWVFLLIVLFISLFKKLKGSDSKP